MIHASRYAVDSNPAATHSLSGCGQIGLRDCPIADIGVGSHSPNGRDRPEKAAGKARRAVA